MANNSGRICIRKKCARLPSDAKSFIPIKAYCEKRFISEKIVRRRIQGNKIRAFFHNGKWYVRDFSASQYIKDYR